MGGGDSGVEVVQVVLDRLLRATTIKKVFEYFLGKSAAQTKSWLRLCELVNKVCYVHELRF